jgi:putative phosphoribosyl transferase
MIMMVREELVRIPTGPAELEGALRLPDNPGGLVIFAHGSGSSRHSPRNNFVARVLNDGGLATLLTDLLTAEEDRDYRVRFDIGLLTERLLAATAWARSDPRTADLPVGYFGASTGAAAALLAAAREAAVGAVVSRGGRPDLAGEALERVAAPVLLIVGGEDHGVIELNEEAYERLRCRKELVIVAGATHLFEEPGTLAEAAGHAAAWFAANLAARAKV